MVDWNKPIEAVHKDGRVIPVELDKDEINPDYDGDYYTTGCFDGINGIWNPDGSPWTNIAKGWHIRNRTKKLDEMMARDHARMREAGCKLAEAALHVIREYDGLHRLSLAVSDWAKAVANEGDRDSNKT